MQATEKVPASDMELRDWFACGAMQGLMRSDIINSAVPALAKATGRDAEFRNEIIGACAQSAYEVADAMLAERKKAVCKP